MWRFAPYILKNLWRHRTRTSLTVSGAAVALFVFCFVGAIQEGLARLTGDEADRYLIVFQASRFCPFTSRMPEDYAETIGKVADVEDVLPIKVFMNNCRASLDVVVFHGIPPDKLKKFRNMTLVAGTWEDFAGKRDTALAGRALAERRGLRVGQPFSIGGVTVTVTGIYQSDQPAEENYLYCHLELFTRAGKTEHYPVTQFEVRLRDGADPQGVARAIDAELRTRPIQTDTRTKGVFQANAVADLVPLIHFSRYLGLACIGMVLALVATTTVMAVQDRVREYAVLQTLGFSSGRIFGLVLSESLLVSLAGGLAGIGLALAAMTVKPMVITTEGVPIVILPSLGVAATGLVVSVVVGALAGLVPAWQAARAEIVESLRYV